MAPTPNFTSKADMLTAFPEPIAKIIGKPNLREIIRIMYHMMECAQSHESAASALGLLFACLPPTMWTAYSQDPYPADPIDPGFVADVPLNYGPVESSNFKEQWNFLKKMHTDFETMNSALIDRFISFMDLAFKQAFNNQRVSNPKIQFRQCLAYFLTQYGHTNEKERADNKKMLEVPWALQDGWEHLQKQVDDVIIYAIFTGQPMTDGSIVDAAMTLVLGTGLFGTQYEQWHDRPDADKTWAHFKDFWKQKVNLKAITNVGANTFGFGGNATAEQAADVDQEFNNSVANFADAHNHTQSTINGLANTNMNLSQAIPQLQQQMQMMQFAMNQMAMMGAQQGNNGNAQWTGGNSNNNGRKKKKNNRNNGGNGGNGGLTGYNNNNNGAAACSTNPRPAHVKLYNNDNYCWTHGHDLPRDHNSKTCNNRHANHNPNATKNNTMGGNPINAERTVWPQAAGYPEIVPKRFRQGNNQQQQQQQWNPNQQAFGGNSMQMPMHQQFGMPAGQPTQQMGQQQPFMPNQQMAQQQFGGSMMQGYPTGFMGGPRFF